MIAGGWHLYGHPLFLDQLERLATAVEAARVRDPDGVGRTASFKLLAALRKLVFETVPSNPTRSEYGQGGTLGPERTHWFRAKFGGGRFRLFFRYDTRSRIIIYAWVNDGEMLRTYGARTDAYAVFRRMLESGDRPDDRRRLLETASRDEARRRMGPDDDAEAAEARRGTPATPGRSRKSRG